MNPTIPGSYLADTHHSKHEPENTRTLARTVWRAILLVSILAFAGAIAFGVWELRAALTVLVVDEQSPMPVNTMLDQKQLRTTIEEFNTRRAHFETAKSATSTAIDPSR